MELAEVLKFIRTNTEWLYVVVYQNKLFFIDYWSFVHFFSGILLPVVLTNLKFKRVYSISTLILIAYEVVEISLIYFAFNVFKPETIKDQFTDIFIGMFGVTISSLMKRKLSFQNLNRKLNLYAVFSSLIVAFLWVGFYKYQYNFEALNTKGLNLWAFLWWSICLFLICQFHLRQKNKFQNEILYYLTLYIFYLIILFVVEFIGYKILGISEIYHSDSTALLFDIIHGTFTLHLFYLTSPFIMIFFIELIKYLFEKFFYLNSSNQLNKQSVIFETAEAAE
jgi:hypothetical protein